MPSTGRIFAFLFLGLSFFSFKLYAADLLPVYGMKFPNTMEEGILPAASRALAPVNMAQLKGFTELLPFVSPSPDQESANSCMLMSLTGAVELLLNKTYNVTPFAQDGDFDLSERWWMNISTYTENTKYIKYWQSDAIYLFNSAPAALNRNYRFTKGWYTETEDDIFKASPNTPNAVYDTRYNWIDEVSKVKGPFVKLPHLSRKILHRDPNDNPWAIGSAPSDIVEQVIEAFQKYKSPVQVIYNHEGYWHSVIVVGYDQNMSSQNCMFINDSLNFYQAEATKSANAGDSKRSKKFLRYKNDLMTSLSDNGGCHPTGMFYVRDSQYPDSSEENYVYDPKNPSANKPYSKRVILREFDWMRSMANHVNVIYPTKANQ